MFGLEISSCFTPIRMYSTQYLKRIDQCKKNFYFYGANPGPSRGVKKKTRDYVNIPGAKPQHSRDHLRWLYHGSPPQYHCCEIDNLGGPVVITL